MRELYSWHTVYMMNDQFRTHIDLLSFRNKMEQGMKKYENGTTNGTHIIDSFMQHEIPYQATCYTSWTIRLHTEYNVSQTYGNKKRNFHLKWIPLSFANTVGKTFTIFGNRTCTPSLRYFICQNMWWYWNNIVITYTFMFFYHIFMKREKINIKH